MRISQDGRVGIGVDNPEEILDVDGDIQLTGDIRFKGYENFQDTVRRFLMIDKTGTTKGINFNQLKAALSFEDCFDVSHEPINPNLPGGGVAGAVR